MKKSFRGYLFAGLLVWVPIWVTLLVIRFVVEIMDGSLALLPVAYQPQNLLGLRVPGFGIILSLSVLLVTGMLVSNYLGRRLIDFGDYLFAKIPLVNTVYHATKQVMNSLLQSTGQSFRKVLLVEYPRRGLWSIAFQTSSERPALADTDSGPVVTIFVPTTPNPTSGFLMVVPTQDVIELDLSVEEALRMVISLGVVMPEHLQRHHR